MFKHLTAVELAARLDYLALCEPNSGAASMLDEATLAFTRKSGEVALAHRAFSASRSAFMHSYHPATGSSPESWAQLTDAARGLAKALRPLGAMVIARCPKCTVPLDDDGACRYDLCPQDENGA